MGHDKLKQEICVADSCQNCVHCVIQFNYDGDLFGCDIDRECPRPIYSDDPNAQDDHMRDVYMWIIQFDVKPWNICKYFKPRPDQLTGGM